jgi:hypothetical protein
MKKPAQTVVTLDRIQARDRVRTGTVKAKRTKLKTARVKVTFVVEWSPQDAAAQEKALEVVGRLLRIAIPNPSKREELAREIVRAGVEALNQEPIQ